MDSPTILMDEAIHACLNHLLKLGGICNQNPADVRMPGLRSTLSSALLLSFDANHLIQHILDCTASLRILQKCQSCLVDQNLVTAKNTVLVKALSMIILSPNLDADATALLEVFPDEMKRDDGRNWLPLSWAIVVQKHNENTNDLDMIYAADPLALQRQSRRIPPLGNTKTQFGYSPAHLLCMRKRPNMHLIKTFMTRDARAFAQRCSDKYDSNPQMQEENGRSCLHLAASYSENVELLRCLLQIDSSQTRKRDTSFGGGFPIKLLCQRSTQFSTFNDLFHSLLDCDKDDEYIAGALKGCALSFRLLKQDGTGTSLSSSLSSPTETTRKRRSFTEVFDDDEVTVTFFEEKVGLMETLLKSHSTVARYRFPDGENLLHVFASFVDHRMDWCVRLLLLVMSLHPGAVYETDAEGNLPVHAAARHNRAIIIEYLLKPYSSSLTLTNANGSNMLHLVACDRDNNADVVREKACFLVTLHPLLLRQLDSNGFTPFHMCVEFGTLSLDLCAIDSTCVFDLVKHPTNPDDSYQLRTPLHVFVLHQFVPTPMCVAATVLRKLLHLHPAAAGAEDRAGMTPYDLVAMGRSNSPWLLRLLLRACPALDPDELHRLNYVERRMALFLSERAITATMKPTIFARLRFENKDIIKKIVSFL